MSVIFRNVNIVPQWKHHYLKQTNKQINKQKTNKQTKQSKAKQNKTTRPSLPEILDELELITANFMVIFSFKSCKNC